jgi:hypothetical protein
LEQEQFDLVISDVHLENGGSVFDFAIWVKKYPKTSRTPFAMFSFHQVFKSPALSSLGIDHPINSHPEERELR